MIQLENDCYISEINVHPKNWKSTKALIKKNWYIYYRFYDPSYRGNSKYKKGMLFMLRGMNKYDSLKDRQNELQRK